LWNGLSTVGKVPILELFGNDISCQYQKNPKKKTTINALDVSAEEMDYQKKLKWLKDHGELTGEEGNNQGGEYCDN
jgi:hypothetical protein